MFSLTLQFYKSVSQARYKSKSSNETGIADGKKAVDLSLQFTASRQENLILN